MKPTFTAWLNEQVKRDGPIGDLAQDVTSDESWPADESGFDTHQHRVFKAYLAGRGASSAAIAAFELAWEQVLAIADCALYQAKRGGRNAAICLAAGNLDSADFVNRLSDELPGQLERGAEQEHPQSVGPLTRRDRFGLRTCIPRVWGCW